MSIKSPTNFVDSFGTSMALQRLLERNVRGVCHTRIHVQYDSHISCGDLHINMETIIVISSSNTFQAFVSYSSVKLKVEINYIIILELSISMYQLY